MIEGDAQQLIDHIEPGFAPIEPVDTRYIHEHVKEKIVFVAKTSEYVERVLAKHSVAEPELLPGQIRQPEELAGKRLVDSLREPNLLRRRRSFLAATYFTCIN